jgi:HSP20 family protein
MIKVKELLIMAGLIPYNRKKSDLMNTGFNDFQNMLDDFFADSWPFRRSLLGDTFKIDVQDNANEYVVEAELPGIQKKEIGLSLDDGKLRISVNKVENVDDKTKNYIHRERRYTSMVRSLALADSDAEGISAKLEEGVLTIVIPKKAKPDTSVNIDIE